MWKNKARWKEAMGIGWQCSPAWPWTPGLFCLLGPAGTWLSWHKTPKMASGKVPGVFLRCFQVNVLIRLNLQILKPVLPNFVIWKWGFSWEYLDKYWTWSKVTFCRVSSHILPGTVMWRVSFPMRIHVRPPYFHLKIPTLISGVYGSATRESAVRNPVKVTFIQLS